jgi:thymidylate synthase (FAD)
MVLPLNHATEWYWTGSVAAFARVCKLRLDPHAQKETQDVAIKIDEALKHAFPVSWDALMTY